MCPPYSTFLLCQSETSFAVPNIPNNYAVTPLWIIYAQEYSHWIVGLAGRIVVPKDVYFPIPRSCKYVTSSG